LPAISVDMEEVAAVGSKVARVLTAGVSEGDS